MPICLPDKLEHQTQFEPKKDSEVDVCKNEYLRADERENARPVIRALCQEAMGLPTWGSQIMGSCSDHVECDYLRLGFLPTTLNLL